MYVCMLGVGALCAMNVPLPVAGPGGLSEGALSVGAELAGWLAGCWLLIVLASAQTQRDVDKTHRNTHRITVTFTGSYSPL